jgi:hypothetical protein
VIGDIGGEIVSTGGVAVRPFWWSTECLAGLGLAPAGGETVTTGAGDATRPSDSADDNSGAATVGPGGTSGHDAAGSEGAGSDGGDTGDGDANEQGSAGLSGGWIALITVLAVVAVGALTGLAFLLGRGLSRSRAVTTRETDANGAPADAAQQTRTAPSFCSQCGRALDPDARFCAGCAKPV